MLALQQRPREVQSVVLPPKGDAEAWSDVQRVAAQAGVSVQTGKRSVDAKALIRPKAAVPIETLIPNQPESGLWLALDCVQDPHNVGAIFRTSAFFGVRGMILLEDRTSALSQVVYDVSSGGVEAVDFSVETNLRRAIDFAKDRGLWIVGTSERATQPLAEIPRDRAYLIVVGNEETGLRRLTLESCDYVCQIPSKGKVQSLNVSVATGVVLSALEDVMNT